MALTAAQTRKDIAKTYNRPEDAAFVAAMQAATDEQIDNLWDAPIVIKIGKAPTGRECELVIRAIEWTDVTWVGKLQVACVSDAGEQIIKRSDMAKVIAAIS